MEYIILPNIDNATEESIVDMSTTNFNAPQKIQKRMAFIFIRNTGINCKLDFSKCSYEDKEEYLLMFLRNDISIQSIQLSSTWLEILLNNKTVSANCILTVSEINAFRSDNQEFINEIMCFCNSLPLYAIKCYGIDIHEYETTDYNEIKLSNFSQIASLDGFVLLYNPDSKNAPKYYTSIFDDDSKAYNMSNIMQALPYFNLLGAMFANKEQQQNVISGLESLYNKGDVK